MVFRIRQIFSSDVIVHIWLLPYVGVSTVSTGWYISTVPVKSLHHIALASWHHALHCLLRLSAFTLWSSSHLPDQQCSSRLTMKNNASMANITPDKDNEPPPAKRAHREEPDVTVIVGGGEFHHYRQILCPSSDYFDDALNSQASNVLEFPDKDPAEWEILSPFLEPMAQAVFLQEMQVMKENVNVLLACFCDLGMKEMIKYCDGAYNRMVFSSEVNFCELDLDMFFEKSELTEDLKELFVVLNKSQEYCLEETRERVCSELGCILGNFPEIFDAKAVSKVVRALCENTHVHEELWEAVCGYLPGMLVSSDEPEALVSNNVLPHLLKVGIDLHLAEAKEEACENTISNKEKAIADAKKEKEKSVTKAKKKTTKVLKVVTELPFELYAKLPSQKYLNLDGYKISEYGRCQLKWIIARKFPDIIPFDW